MSEITLITRSFQSGAGKGVEFDDIYFESNVVKPIKNILTFKNIKQIMIISNGDQRINFSEALLDKNRTPTITAFEIHFANEIRSNRIICHTSTNWGENPGSATALNEGIEIARKETDWVLLYSTEIKLNENIIADAFCQAKKNKLAVIGFLREYWQQRIQWQVVQNTAAIWNIPSLLKVDLFAQECNGMGETIYLEPYGDISIAGMEDFHAMLRMLKNDFNFRWGMIGQDNPLPWNVNFEAGSQREFSHNKKVARQEIVMKKYAKQIFPDLTFEQVMEKLYKHYQK
jgi:hypothetical protein